MARLAKTQAVRVECRIGGKEAFPESADVTTGRLTVRFNLNQLPSPVKSTYIRGIPSVPARAVGFVGEAAEVVAQGSECRPYEIA
jgi:hypothetical protein